MHTAQLLKEALDLARSVGFLVRHDNFGGSGGGACQLLGRKVLFVDLALWPDEQLERVLAILSEEPGLERLSISDQLRRMLWSRQACQSGKRGTVGCRHTVTEGGKLGSSQ